MISLVNASTNSPIGEIGEEDLEVMIDVLEEESEEDQDYFIDAPTIELLEDRGASAQLLSLLRAAVGESEGVEVKWEKG
jgi:hypothetical protein